MLNAILQPSHETRQILKSKEIIYRNGHQFIEEKKRRVLEGEKNGTAYGGTDLLTYLCESCLS